MELFQHRMSNFKENHITDIINSDKNVLLYFAKKISIPSPPSKMFRLLRPYPTQISNPHLWSEHGYFPEPCITQIDSLNPLD